MRNALRRGASRGELVSWIVLGDRQSWCCYLCALPLDRALRGTVRPDAPEIEHRVPVVRGGAHTYQNTALAHRRCNKLKGVA